MISKQSVISRRRCRDNGPDDHFEINENGVLSTLLSVITTMPMIYPHTLFQ